ncbi:porin [Duncaniella muris]|uniref:porin n=1 Tax=Duncaniella muris TaxID=2094150 RepID=UPI0025B79497|nr:porin [Duncaniella muris]
MNSLIHFAAVVPALCAFAGASSQNHPLTPQEGEVTIINPSATRSDSGLTVINIYNIFLQNAPKSHKKSGVPNFAIEGKNKKFYLGIGGTAKATLSYDWGDPIDNGFNFTTSSIPMNPRKGDGGLVQFSAATSGLYLNFVALPGDKNQLGVYIDFNLTGNSYGFDLQYAYIKYRGFTAGYDYSLFSDMAAAPPSIDNEGPCGFTAIPNGVLDYRHSFGQHWSLGVGVEMPMVSATTGEKTYVVNQRVPDIPAYVQYSWGGGKSWLRFSGIVRNMLYRDEIADKNRDQVGWGVKMSGSASLTPLVTAYYQAAYGEGITSYFQDLYEGGLDMVPDGSGRLKAVKAWGGYFGLQYNISPKVYATTTYSHLRNYAPDYSGGSTAWDSQYKYAQYALANVIWQISPHLSTGLEYIYGRRVDMSGLSHHDNRIQTMLQVTF